MNFIYSNLLKFKDKYSNLSLLLYNRLPHSIQRIIFNKFSTFKPIHHEVSKNKKLELLPLDSACSEVIFAPFHDPVISATLPVILEPINAQNCSMEFFWCWTVLTWNDCPEQKEAAVINLTTDLELLNFDELITCLTIPKETVVRFELKQNNEWIAAEAEFQGTGRRMEIILPLKKGNLDAIKLYFKPCSMQGQSVQLSWIGLRNSALHQLIKNNQLQFSPEWHGLIKPAIDWGTLKFEMGLLFSETELKTLRLKKTLPGWSTNFKLLEKKATEYLKRQPEKDLSEYLPYNDSRYQRESEFDTPPYYFEALVLGFVGMVNENKIMMRHALRYLMCLIHTKHWTQSGESRLTGSTWDQRCFLEEMTTTTVSILSDWFASALTDRAKELIRNSIYDKGLAIIERDMMKYEYLYQINQGAVFCRARILGGIYLKKSWPRVGKYVERAFSDMTQCLRNYIETDGGSHEGTGYLCQTLQAALPAIIVYSRHKNTPPKKYLKKYFARCENYISALSGSQPGTTIVDGDCRTNFFCGDSIPVLAGFFPEGSCAKILKSCIKAGSIFSVTGTLTNSGGIVGFIYGPDHIIDSECIVPTFTILKKTGHLTSYRTTGKHSVRFHLTGSRPNPHHSHFDKGALQLEVDAVPMIIDRGMIDYYFSQANELKRSYMHNVLTPQPANCIYPDQKHPTKPIIPHGKGNTNSLQADIDLTNVWEDHMINYSRAIQSKDLDSYLIIDKGMLRDKGRLAFHLHSTFPFKIIDKKAIIRNKNITITIETLWAESLMSCQESVNLHHDDVYHLICHSSHVKQFRLNTWIKIMVD